MTDEILFVHLLNDRSGSPRVLRDFIESEAFQLAERHILTSQHCGILDECSAEKHFFFYARSKWRYLTLLMYLLAQIQISVRVIIFICCCRLRGCRPTVVCNTMLPVGALAAAWLLSVKAVCYLHEVSVSPAVLKSILRRLVNRFATNVIYVSRYLCETEFFDSPRSHVLFNGLSKEFDMRDWPNYTTKHRAQKVLFVGSPKAYKGVQELVDLALLLPEIHFMAVLNGSEAEFRAVLNCKRLPANLEVQCNQKNLSSFYRDSFVILNLSHTDGWVETFALTLLEGMAFGCAVVAPLVGGHRDYIGSEHGLIVDSRDTSAIAAFIRRCCLDFDFWQSFSLASLETAKTMTYKAYSLQASAVWLDIMDDSDSMGRF